MGGVREAAHLAGKGDLPRRQARLRPRVRSRAGSDDILIPPRRPSGPSHEIVDTATAYLVRVHFPGALSLADLRWELTDDVLEVEYAAAGVDYYENFLIPTASAPQVSIQDHVFEAQFPKTA